MVKQDINFLEKPLWVIDTDQFKPRIVKHGSKEIVKYVWETDALQYEAGWGIPTQSDGIILMYLLMKAQQIDWQEKQECTIYSILKGCGFNINTRNYQKIKNSLNTWKNVTVHFNESFYAKTEQPDGSFLGQFSELHCNIIDMWGIPKGEKNKIFVRFSPEWLQIIKESKYYKLIDFEKYKTFTSPIAARLYEILIKTFERRVKWEIGAVKLAEKITMKDRYASVVKRKIEAAVNQINRKTDLKIIVESVKLGRGKIKFVFQKNYSATRIEDQDLPLVQTKRELKAPRDIFELIPEVYRPDCISICNEIFEKDGAECLIGCIRYVIDAGKKADISNFGGYMRRAYKEGYWRSFVIKQEEQQQLEQAQGAKQEEERKLQFEKAQQAKANEDEQRQRKELVEELKEAYPEEYEELYQEAVKEVGDKRIGRKLLINLAMQRRIDDFLKQKGLD